MPTAIITPRLPPSMDGLADFCYQLWQHWPTNEKPMDFLVLDSAEQSGQFWPEIRVNQFEPSKNGLLHALSTTNVDTIFLQYVGYGYDINGAPAWLPEVLRNWLNQDSKRKLITMFHETWSSGNPWQKVFWYMGKQKNCVKDLITLSSEIGTSCQVNKASLDLLGTNRSIHIIPLGCSFSVVANSQKNWQQLLIFGKEYARLRGLKTHKNLLQNLIEKKLIERIVLAGQLDSPDNDMSLQIVQKQLPAVEITTAYNFSSTNIPQSVIASGLSLMHTQSTHMLKSTSFHLAAKLGQVALAEDLGAADAPFIKGQHYLSYTKASEADLLQTLTNTKELEAISQQVSQLAETYLSWTAIAAKWSSLLS